VPSVNKSYEPAQLWLTRALCVIAFGSATAGCGNAIYAVQVNAASSKVEEAHELGAEQYAPYEYYYAKEHLEKAQTEAAEADYSDAVDLADKAIRLAREAHRGAGR
jgi:hypothetical protein